MTFSANGFPVVRRTTGKRWRPVLRILTGAALLIPPVLGSAAGLAPTVAAAPAARIAAAPFSDGRCTSGDTSSVTVVIDFQQLGGGSIIRCAHGLSAGARGNAALAAAGITYAGTARYGAAFVCRILGRPGPTETLPLTTGGYREPCTNTPPAQAYWSYWQANEGGAWEYSRLGILPQKARLGGFEGWSFSMNATADSNPEPRVDTTLSAPTPPPTTEKPTTTRPAPTTATPRPTAPRPTPPPTRAQPPVVPTTTAPVTTRHPVPTTGPAVSVPPTPAAGTDTPTTDVPRPTDPTAEPEATIPETPATPTAATGGGSAGAASAGIAGKTSGAASSRSTTSGSASTNSASTNPATTNPATTNPTTRSRTSIGRTPPSRPGSSPGAVGSDAPASITPTVPPWPSGSPVIPARSIEADPTLAATGVEPDSSSPWPVIGVLALALIAGGAAFVIARRRRGDEV